jgi:hypothetical protein
MIGREICREEISNLISDYFLADTFDQQIALTDIIMDQITSIPLEALSINKIRETIEREITVWMRINQK